MHVYEPLRWLGVLSLGIILAAGLWPLKGRLFDDPGRSVSQSWSAVRKPRLLGTLLTVAGAGLCAFIVGWLTPMYRLGPLMYVLAAVGFLGLLAVAWVPIAERPGEHSLKHPHFIGGVAAANVAVVAYILIICAAPKVPPISYNLAVIALIFSASWPVFFVKGVRSYFLVLEGVFVLLLVAVMLLLTMGW